MNKLTIIILFLFFSTTYVHAGYFMSHDNGLIKRRVKSCGSVCSNDSSLIRITEQEYIDSGSSNKKFDTSIVTGNRIVDMTQAEIDTIAQDKADAQALAEINRIEALDLTIPELVDALVDLGIVTKKDIKDKVKIKKGITP